MSEHFAWIYDKTRGVKTWVADMWSRRHILTLEDDVSDLQTAVGTIPTKTSDLINDSGYVSVTGGTLTFNNTSYNQQYVSSASGTWQRVGNIVVFNVEYKMAANISALLADVFTDMPPCSGIRHFLSESTTREVVARHVSVSGTSLNIAGSHTAGTTYYASGAYLAQ